MHIIGEEFRLKSDLRTTIAFLRTDICKLYSLPPIPSIQSANILLAFHLQLDTNVTLRRHVMLRLSFKTLLRYVY